MNKKRLSAAIIALCAASNAHAVISTGDLIAIGSLSGTASDLSGLSAPLEDGVAANLLGGMGSGFAYAGGNTFIAVPDRGSNATTYNALVDNTTSYITRFQTVTMDLTPNTSGTGLPFNLTPTLTGTTLFSNSTPLNYGTGAGLGNKIDGVTPIGSGAPTLNDANHFYFTGRSDNYGAGSSTNANNARFDPEAVRVSNDGKSVFVSDEYGPYVYQFDRATGNRIRTFDLPANLAISNLSPVGATEISGNTSGRVANKGMEGLAITPDGSTLVGIMQAPLEQDTNKWLRIVTIDIASGTTHEYGYKLTTGTGVSDIVAINNHEFFVDERDGKGLGDNNAAPTLAVVKQIFKIDLNGATDVTGFNDNLNNHTVTAVTKSSSAFLDIVNKITTNTNAGMTAAFIPSKLEGIAFGQDFTVEGAAFHSLYVANDNDFSATAVPNGSTTPVANNNKFFVFAIANSDLSSYQAQSVPEPTTFALLGLGLAGLAFAQKRRKA